MLEWLLELRPTMVPECRRLVDGLQSACLPRLSCNFSLNCKVRSIQYICCRLHTHTHTHKHTQRINLGSGSVHDGLRRIELLNVSSRNRWERRCDRPHPIHRSTPSCVFNHRRSVKHSRCWRRGPRTLRRSRRGAAIHYGNKN